MIDIPGGVYTVLCIAGLLIGGCFGLVGLFVIINSVLRQKG